MNEIKEIKDSYNHRNIEISDQQLNHINNNFPNNTNIPSNSNNYYTSNNSNLQSYSNSNNVNIQNNPTSDLNANENKNVDASKKLNLNIPSNNLNISKSGRSLAHLIDRHKIKENLKSYISYNSKLKN